MTPAAHAHQALTGAGAALRGGRWNSRGTPAVYASLDPATTVLELLTTFDPEETPKGGFHLLKLSLPQDVSLFEPAAKDLPAAWDVPEKALDTQFFGDKFLKAAQYPVMIVPSVALTEARNAVINPLHPRSKDIRIVHARPFSFDPRWPLKGR